MITRRSIVPALLLLGLGLTAVTDATAFEAPDWWLSLRSAGYFYATEDRDGLEGDHLRFYQYGSAAVTGLANGRVSLRVAGRYADNLRDDDPRLESSRLHIARADLRLADGLRARLGRQFLHEGVAALTLDGVHLSMQRGRRWQLAGWAGAGAPGDYAAEVQSLADEKAFGARVVYRARRVRIGLSGASRWRGGDLSTRLGGIDLHASPSPRLQLTGRVGYDFEGGRPARLDALARWFPAPDLPTVTVQYVDRYPLLDATSWFARFTDIERIRLARAQLEFESEARFGGRFEYLGAFIDGRNSTRVNVAVLLPPGSIGYSMRMGEAGEESALFGEFSIPLGADLRLEGSATMLTYALLEAAPPEEDREVTTLAGRIRARLTPRLGLIAEMQSLDNPYFSSDLRMLVAVDLKLGGGRYSRFGQRLGGLR